MENSPFEQKPLISIVIPVYNGADYVKQAIDSALSQTYENKEILVINDGSTDETEKIALSYGDKIRYFYKPNGGVSSALNEGIRQMRGEYFSWLSHDDFYLPEKLAKEAALASPDSLVMCGRFLVDKDSKILGDARETLRFQQNCRLDWQDALISLFQQGCFNGCTLLIPKIAFLQVGFFDENLRYCQDLLMWIQLFLSGFRLQFLSEKLVCSRVHTAQLTNTNRPLFRKESTVLCNAILSELCEKSTKTHNFLFAFACFNAVYGNREAAMQSLLAGKEKGVLSFGDRTKIRLKIFYGRLRPTIRKLYYRLFKKMKSS